MPTKVTHKPNRAAITALLTSPNGPVAKDMLRRGVKVQSRARQLLGGAGPGHPKRVDTGLLRSSVQVHLVFIAGKPAVRIGSNLAYAVYVHDGTGLYGLRHRKIIPKRAKALSWVGPDGRVFARSIKGMRPNSFLKDALVAARD